MRRRASCFAAVGLSFVLLGSAAAYADELVDFGTGSAGAGGQIKYDGAGGSLIGSGILLGVMTAVGTPNNEGVHLTSGPAACAIVMCAQLDFTTGALNSYSNGVYSFKQGGTFTITGGIPQAGITTQPLVWGTFSSESVLDGGQLKLLAATGGDNFSPLLLNYLGIAPGTPFQFIGSVIGMNFGYSGSGGAFNALAVSSDISSIATPEPTSLALMFLGAGFMGVRRFRRRQSESATPVV